MEKSSMYTLRLDDIMAATSAASSTLTHATSVTWRVGAGAGEVARVLEGRQTPARVLPSH
jgi:hypothetical protein